MKTILFVFAWMSVSASRQSSSDTSKIKEYYRKGFACELHSWQRQAYMDSILMLNHGEAYAWQQKSMPLFKQKKYEIAMPFLDSAVKYDMGVKWLEYRAFIKCVFQKQYRESLLDFERAERKPTAGLVMDHSYDFFKGLCHLQLNHPDSAIFFISKSIGPFVHRAGIAHPTETFYLGIAFMEKCEYRKAIAEFDRAIEAYPQFSDALYYKSKCLMKLGQTDHARDLKQMAAKYYALGYTINEDSVYYEDFPYQVKKYWFQH